MASIRRLLNDGKVVFVTFTKKNGETRRMICTQNLSYIPRSERPKGLVSHDPAQIRVWDVVAREWRSMIYDSITVYEEYGAAVDK